MSKEIDTKLNVQFTQASTRANITSGENISTSFGKIKKYFADLKSGAFTDAYTHPTYTSKSSGLYKITVDGTGHVSAATAVTSSDLPSHTHSYIPLSGSDAITGNLMINTVSRGLYLTDKSGASYAGIIDNGSNLWIGARETTSQTSTTHHVGATFISSGYDSTTSAGNKTIKISVPNATNTSATNYAVLHEGNTSFTRTTTSGDKIGTLTINDVATDMYAANDKVYQSKSTTNTFRPVLLSALNNSSHAALFNPELSDTPTITGQAYGNPNIFVKPDTGNLYANAFTTVSRVDTGNGVMVLNNAINFRLKYTDSADTSYDLNRDCIRIGSGGLTTNKGYGLYIDSAGLTVIGGGESAAHLSYIIDDDQSVTGAAKLNVSGTTENFTQITNDSEQLILSSDNNIYFVTKCDTIENRVAVALNANKAFYPDVTGTGSIGTSSYHWGTAYIDAINGRGLNLCDGTKYSYFIASARSTSSTEPAHVLFGSSINGAAFAPGANSGDHDLGLIDSRWNKVYARQVDLTGGLSAPNISATISIDGPMKHIVADSVSATYGLTLHETPGFEGSRPLQTSDSIRAIINNSATAGVSALVVGNNTSAANGGKYGIIRVYNSSTSYLQFNANGSANSMAFESSSATAGDNFRPGTADRYDLGTSSYKWRNVYATTLILGDSAASASGGKIGTIQLYGESEGRYCTLTCTGTKNLILDNNAGTGGTNFSPAVTNAYDLGTSSATWRNVYATTLNGALAPSNLSSAVPVSKGGTGATTLTSGQVLVGNGTNAVGTRAIATSVTSGSTSLVTSGAVYSALGGPYVGFKTYDLYPYEKTWKAVGSSGNRIWYINSAIDVSADFVKVLGVCICNFSGCKTWMCFPYSASATTFNANLIDMSGGTTNPGTYFESLTTAKFIIKVFGVTKTALP